MSEIQKLLSSYPLSELIVLMLMVLAGTQAVWKVIEFYLEKANIIFGEKAKKQEWRQKLMFDIENLANKISELRDQNVETHKRQDQTEKKLALIQERMQENTRSFLIDSHHRFCYEYKQIDDLSLQSIERRYLYYKTAGGDTFIDHLMEEIRTLPRVNYYEKPSIE